MATERRRSQAHGYETDETLSSEEESDAPSRNRVVLAPPSASPSPAAGAWRRRLRRSISEGHSPPPERRADLEGVSKTNFLRLALAPQSAAPLEPLPGSLPSAQVQDMLDGAVSLDAAIEPRVPELHVADSPGPVDPDGPLSVTPASAVGDSARLKPTEEVLFRDGEVKWLRRTQEGDLDCLQRRYRRLVVTGPATDMSDMQDVAESMLRALWLRQRYMLRSRQWVSPTARRFLDTIDHPKDVDAMPVPADTISLSQEECDRLILDMRHGVAHVYRGDVERAGGKVMFPFPTLKTFYRDLGHVLALTVDGPTKSHAFRRLQLLESKFQMHTLLNEVEELAEQKSVPHRDFYNVRKVDTHIHLASCMNQKHLLRFIKKKLRDEPAEIVTFRDGRLLSLRGVFDSLNLTVYDLSVDTLDVHADRSMFHRFDKFNLKYNPVGESRLREIFLKTDNRIGGRYLAEITNEVLNDLEESKYTHTELRVSVYGKSRDEFARLADWVADYGLHSDNNRWVPRLYNVYKSVGQVTCFAEMLENVFQPLFDATLHPDKHPKLQALLEDVVGFDSVDDESKPEPRAGQSSGLPFPDEWNGAENPPYAYYLYHMHANITVLNALRASRGMNTFALRPHCGEAGPVDHLAAAFLTSESISHGILLRKVPVLQYLYYLCEIGIAMSPLSNHSLFLHFNRNPLPEYFARGLNVSLSTDDPLMFHFTREPLMEEYSIAAQVWKLSAADMCELAAHSVRQSGYSLRMKKRWLGEHFEREGAEGNDINKTNVPRIRAIFRTETLCEEWKELVQGRQCADP